MFRRIDVIKDTEFSRRISICLNEKFSSKSQKGGKNCCFREGMEVEEKRVEARMQDIKGRGGNSNSLINQE